MSLKAREDERKFILECINLYHRLPALWNINCKEYSNRFRKNEQYDCLLRKYREKYPDADRHQLVRKLNSLRTNFRKELRRINNLRKSKGGADERVETTLWYYDEMKFLADLDASRSLQNSIKIEYEDLDQGEIEENINYTYEDEALEDSNSKLDELQDFAPLELTSQHDIQAPNHDIRSFNHDTCVSNCFQHTENEFEKIASTWAIELQKMHPQQQLFAKKAINDILFEGQMGTLRRDSLQINST